MNNRPPGVALAKAFIARTTAPAASLLNQNQVYVRLDGERVGTGTDIIQGTMDTGVWQRNNGLYKPDGDLGRVWTGATSPTAAGTTASTCGDWQDSSQTSGRVGDSLWEHLMFSFHSLACNTTGAWQGQLYCFEP